MYELVPLDPIMYSSFYAKSNRQLQKELKKDQKGLYVIKKSKK